MGPVGPVICETGLLAPSSAMDARKNQTWKDHLPVKINERRSFNTVIVWAWRQWGQFSGGYGLGEPELAFARWEEATVLVVRSLEGVSFWKRCSGRWRHPVLGDV